MKIAILGADGFLGKELFVNLKSRYDVCGITKSNYDVKVGETFNVFINANGNSKRFWAANKALDDFNASTVSVYRTFFDFKIGHYIYISSSDVYDKHDDILSTTEETAINSQNLCPYGFNKYLSEVIVKRYAEKYLILRCSAMVGEGMKKGPIKDMIESKPLYISSDSRLQFINTKEIANIVAKMIDGKIHNEIFNIGGIGTVSCKDLGKIFNKQVIVHHQAERQIYEMNVTKLKKQFPVNHSEEYIKSVLLVSVKGE